MPAVTVTTTATRLDAPSASRGASSIAVYNNGASTVYVGGSDVTTANGYPIAAGQHYAEDLERSGSLYGIVAAGTVEVRTRLA